MIKGRRDNSKGYRENVLPLEAAKVFIKQGTLVYSSICLVQAKIYTAKQTAIYCCYALLMCLLEHSLAMCLKIFKMFIHDDLVISLWGIHRKNPKYRELFYIYGDSSQIAYKKKN